MHHGMLMDRMVDTLCSLHLGSRFQEMKMQKSNELWEIVDTSALTEYSLKRMR